jgi:hypothetical protein
MVDYQLGADQRNEIVIVIQLRFDDGEEAINQQISRKKPMFDLAQMNLRNSDICR